jgi:hypothetical protein
MRKLLLSLILVSNQAFAQITLTPLDYISIVYQGVKFFASEPVPKEISVTAKGSGKTREQAIENALTEAVQKGIGVLVVSDQTVSNDKVVRNLSAQYASGVVNSYNVVYCNTFEPIICEIKAKVAPWKFIRKLEGNSNSVKVNGNDLYAQDVTARNVLYQRQRVMEYYLFQVRQSGLEAKIKKVEVVPTTEKFASILVDYEIKWNEEFKKEFIRFLKKMEKDTQVDAPHQIHVQWDTTGLFENKVTINIHDEKFYQMVRKSMHQPTYVKFNEFKVCDNLNIDFSIFAIDIYGVSRQRVLKIEREKLKSIQTISMALSTECD